ncbi:BMP family lipoprotein [Enterococcus rivorum]|uniref:BMP family ABC transporter substrate-binding protein n=1 Tax=Enterococcus rivorum TaxID=762845 RepID=A0A1E5KZ39_9ENTE|nr:BMP family protein [Enterococcus rivorum]MBP2097618.1 basic membrane protein A [Enterococcus rivorum]OEH83064.1 BMP family ABC transporter substrate-binding protein [Enterococcus rivorum]
MKKKTFMKAIFIGACATLVLTACGGGKGKEKESSSTGTNTVAIVTDIGGVDDKSFNQSAWEGLQEWGKKHDLKKGPKGYNYLQSKSDSEYVTNLNIAAGNGFKTVFGIGHKVRNAVEDVASQKKNVNFVIVDAVIDDLDNVASVVFKDNEAAFLAGIAAAETTKAEHVGFIGGQNGEVIDRFEAGFRQGVATVNPDIKVDVQYVGSFGDPAKAKSQAAAMYNDGVDIIYQAAGNSGNGVFSEAKDIKKRDKSKEIWVIGVDRDQSAEGEIDGENVTLTSTIKGVGKAVIDISDKALENKFPGGEKLVFGLKEAGVDLSEGQLGEKTKESIKKYKQEIADGKLKVVEKPSELK